ARTGRARRGGGGGWVGVDVDEAGLDFSDPVRVARALGLAQKRIPLEVGLEHNLDQALRAVRSLLGEAADPPAARRRDAARLNRQFAADGAKQRGLADPVAADKANARARDDLHGTVIDQEASGDANGDVGEGQHAAWSPEPLPNATRFWVEITRFAAKSRASHESS